MNTLPLLPRSWWAAAAVHHSCASSGQRSKVRSVMMSLPAVVLCSLAVNVPLVCISHIMYFPFILSPFYSNLITFIGAVSHHGTRAGRSHLISSHHQTVMSQISLELNRLTLWRHKIIWAPAERNVSAALMKTMKRTLERPHQTKTISYQCVLQFPAALLFPWMNSTCAAHERKDGSVERGSGRQRSHLLSVHSQWRLVMEQDSDEAAHHCIIAHFRVDEA